MVQYHAGVVVVATISPSFPVCNSVFKTWSALFEVVEAPIESKSWEHVALAVKSEVGGRDTYSSPHHPSLLSALLTQCSSSDYVTG